MVILNSSVLPLKVGLRLDMSITHRLPHPCILDGVPQPCHDEHSEQENRKPQRPPRPAGASPSLAFPTRQCRGDATAGLAGRFRRVASLVDSLSQR